MGYVNFKLQDQITTAEILDQQTRVSQNTGKDLFQLEVYFKAHKDRRDFYVQALQNGTAILLPADGDILNGVVVSLYEKQYSYTEGEPIQHCTWLLTQKEELAVESLQIGDITVSPYKYNDEFSKESLICNFCFDVDAETYKYVRNLPIYFSVTRKGISDVPRSMRFGLVVWSSEDEQTYRLKATLVEENYDKDQTNQGLMEPMFSNVMEQLAITTIRLSKLLNLLESKGILTKEEAKNIIEIPDSERKEQRELFCRVKNFDKWIENED